jgi:hypothetical protein
MKFEKLKINAFKKEKLTENGLRSVNGGIIQLTRWGGSDAKDWKDDNNCTHWPDGDVTCDDTVCP